MLDSSETRIQTGVLGVARIQTGEIRPREVRRNEKTQCRKMYFTTSSRDHACLTLVSLQLNLD